MLNIHYQFREQKEYSYLDILEKYHYNYKDFNFDKLKLDKLKEEYKDITPENMKYGYRDIHYFMRCAFNHLDSIMYYSTIIAQKLSNSKKNVKMTQFLKFVQKSDHIYHTLNRGLHSLLTFVDVGYYESKKILSVFSYDNIMFLHMYISSQLESEFQELADLVSELNVDPFCEEIKNMIKLLSEVIVKIIKFDFNYLFDYFYNEDYIEENEELDMIITENITDLKKYDHYKDIRYDELSDMNVILNGYNEVINDISNNYSNIDPVKLSKENTTALAKIEKFIKDNTSYVNTLKSVIADIYKARKFGILGDGLAAYTLLLSDIQEDIKATYNDVIKNKDLTSEVSLSLKELAQVFKLYELVLEQEYCHSEVGDRLDIANEINEATKYYKGNIREDTFPSLFHFNRTWEFDEIFESLLPDNITVGRNPFCIAMYVNDELIFRKNCSPNQFAC